MKDNIIPINLINLQIEKVKEQNALIKDFMNDKPFTLYTTLDSLQPVVDKIHNLYENYCNNLLIKESIKLEWDKIEELYHNLIQDLMDFKLSQIFESCCSWIEEYNKINNGSKTN